MAKVTVASSSRLHFVIAPKLFHIFILESSDVCDFRYEFRQYAKQIANLNLFRPLEAGRRFASSASEFLLVTSCEPLHDETRRLW